MARVDIAIADLKVWVDIFSEREACTGALVLTLPTRIGPEDAEIIRAELEPYAKTKGWSELKLGRPE